MELPESHAHPAGGITRVERASCAWELPELHAHLAHGLSKRQRIVRAAKELDEARIAANRIEFRFGAKPNQPGITRRRGLFEISERRIVIAQGQMRHRQ